MVKKGETEVEKLFLVKVLEYLLALGTSLAVNSEI